MKRPSRPRTAAELPKSLHQQLNAYALAASAAGVGVLALSHPAEAKIVYTHAHVSLQEGKPFPLDLNHDGMVDFFLIHGYVHISTAANTLWACHQPTKGYYSSFCSFSSSRAPNALNAIRVIGSEGQSWGAALRSGAKIQQQDRFVDRHRIELGSLRYANSFSNPGWFGPWMNAGKGVKNRYLGIKFKIDGRFHFGWARVTVTTASHSFTATLTGYAYETIPGKAIVAGKTKGPNEIDKSFEQPNPASLAAPTPEPASLGLLALGSPGLSIWRREDSNVAVFLDSSNTTIEDVNIAGFSDGIRVGSLAPAQSDVLLNIFGNTHATGVGTPIIVVHIYNAMTNSSPNVSDLSVMGVNNAGPTGTNAISDLLTSTLLPDAYVAMFALGKLKNGGYSRFTTSPNAATWAAGTSAATGMCNASTAGSLYSNTSPSASPALYVCPAGGGHWVPVK